MRRVHSTDSLSRVSRGLLLILGANVQAQVSRGEQAVWRTGVICGRTLEDNPRYDVRFADGSIAWNLPADRLRPETPEPLGVPRGARRR